MPSVDLLNGVVVALDIDGVLLDSERRGGAGPWQLAVAERFGVSPSELQRCFFERRWPDVIVGRASIDEALGEVIAEQSWPVSVEEFLDCWFEADFWTNSDVIGAASSWGDRGARLTLVTNQEHRRAAYVATRLGELLPIEQMVYSANVGYLKSEPKFFDAATHVLRGADHKSPIVFIDDTLFHVEVARRAGWTAVHFQADSWEERMEDALGRAAITG